MSVLPQSRLARVQFCETHNPVWSAAATQIGTTAAKVTALTTKTTAARAAFAAQQAAIEASKAATVGFNNAVRDMTTAAAEILKEIKAAASVDPNVYELAQIPPPATPGPAAAPGMPEALKVQLNPDGSLSLSWKCNNPPGGGVIYQIYRRIGSGGGGGDFVHLSASGAKKFTDSTLPSVQGPVTYKIVGVRSTSMGVANEFTVNFGVGGGGQMTATVSGGAGGAGGSPAPKLAA